MMRKKNTEISDRISALIEALGINPNAFAVALGYRRSQTIYDILNGKCAPSFDFFNKLANSEFAGRIDLGWVITGRGDLLRTPSSEDPAPAPGFLPAADAHRGVVYPVAQERLQGDVADKEGCGGLRPGMRRIPLYEPSAGEGPFALFGCEAQVPACYLQMPGLPSCDGALTVWGDAMAPRLNAGDVVLYEWVRDPAAEIVWGRIYLLILRMDGREYIALQTLERAAAIENVRCASATARYAAREIPCSAIRARALVTSRICCASLA